MRKLLSVLITLCLTVCLVSTTVSAAVADPGISPNYNYVTGVYPKVISAGTNSVKYSCNVVGKSGTTQVKIYLYLEEYYNGEWRGIDAVSTSVNGKDATVSDTHSAVKGRKYRCYTNVYAYKGSDYEKITRYSSIITK